MSKNNVTSSVRKHYCALELGAVHKGRSQSGEEGLSSADIFRTRGVLQKRTSALFGAKNSDFSKWVGSGGGGKGGN